MTAKLAVAREQHSQPVFLPVQKSSKCGKKERESENKKMFLPFAGRGMKQSEREKEIKGEKRAAKAADGTGKGREN